MCCHANKTLDSPVTLVFWCQRSW